MSQENDDLDRVPDGAPAPGSRDRWWPLALPLVALTASVLVSRIPSLRGLGILLVLASSFWISRVVRGILKI